MEEDYSNIETLITKLNNVLNLENIGYVPSVPIPLILFGVPRRQGLSANKIATNIITRKHEAGLSVGLLPNGEIPPDEIMERIRVEEIIKALKEEGVITVALPPGIPLTGSGLSPAGPVTVIGLTTNYAKGYGIIQ